MSNGKPAEIEIHAIARVHAQSFIRGIGEVKVDAGMVIACAGANAKATVRLEHRVLPLSMPARLRVPVLGGVGAEVPAIQEQGPQSASDHQVGTAKVGVCGNYYVSVEKFVTINLWSGLASAASMTLLAALNSEAKGALQPGTGVMLRILPVHNPDGEGCNPKPQVIPLF